MAIKAQYLAQLLPDLTLPRLSLNGSPRERLLEQYTDCAEAIRKAIFAHTVTEPNERDYTSRADWQTAITEAREREKHLRHALTEIWARAYHVADAAGPEGNR